MSRSPYIDNVVLTNKHSGKRTHKVQAFVIHHMAAKWTGKYCAEYFRDTPSRQASANYCIGYNGDVALNVEEENRAWTSSSNWADQRAITYELANSKMGEPWEVSDKTIQKAIVMLAEQHKRYGLKKATYTGDTSGTLWRHDWFAKTNCPGAYLGGKFAYMAQEINKILGAKEPIVSGAKAYKLVTTVNGYINAGDAKNKKNAKTKVKAGNYTVFKESNGMINVASKVGVAGNWINPEENKAPSTPAKPSVTAEVITKSYTEKETLIPDRTINVYDKPSKAAKVVATYYKNEPVTYHKVHIGKQNIWIQYTRDGGKGEGYMPVQNVVNGKGKGLFGTIKPKAAAKAKKTYVKLAAHEPTWTVYALGQQPIAANSTKKLAPRQYGGLEYEVLGYEDNGQCAIIQTESFGRCKIFIKDPSATIYTK